MCLIDNVDEFIGIFAQWIQDLTRQHDGRRGGHGWPRACRSDDTVPCRTSKAARPGLTAACTLGLAAGGAQAGSAPRPGQTVGLPTGAQLPVGLYLGNLSSFGQRETWPLRSESTLNLPTFAWSTPWHLPAAPLQFCFTQPGAAASAGGPPYQSGIGQPLLAAQLAWDLGNDVGV